MARPVRIEFAGALYHITSRGDRREAIYEDDTDRFRFLEVLGEVVERFNWRCHAYCLMTNHYHLVVETVDGNLSKGMRQLNGVYTQWSNRRHRRTGHLLQGRYKAILVDSEAYLLELARYVVLNPVRAQEKIRQAAFECPRCARRRERCGLSRRHDEGASGGHGQRLAHRAWGSVEIISAGLQGFASVVEDEEAL